jgi:hypothetical protein
MIKLVRELHWSGLLKWDSDEHPRWPTGSEDSKGGKFAPKGQGGDTGAPSTTQSYAVDRQRNSDTAHRSARVQLADKDVSDAAGDPIADAIANAATVQREGKAHGTATPVVTAADMANFGPSHLKEAQQLAAKLGHGATAQEFLALSSVESSWGTSFVAHQAFNFFGAHNVQEGPFPGQTGTYVTSGHKGVPGHMEPGWLPPRSPRDPVQNVAAFAATTGYMDSGAVVVARLSGPKALAESGGDYSDPAVFFATVHSNGWGEGVKRDYVHTLLQRIRHF